MGIILQKGRLMKKESLAGYIFSILGPVFLMGIGYHSQVELYTTFQHDVGCTRVVSPPAGGIPPGNYDVIGRIQNFGENAETFDATATVYDTTGGAPTPIWSQTVTLINLPVGADTNVNFGMITLPDFPILVEICTQLNGDQDPSNDICYSGSFIPSTLGQVIFEIDVQAPTGDNQCLGIEFDGTYFYITGGNAGMDPNKVYVIDTIGTLIWAIDQPSHSTGWGWRDLCWDGTYAGPGHIDTLYALYSGNLHKFEINLASGVLNYHGAVPLPGISGRTLAYKPDSQWFFTASFNTIYKFSKGGALLDTTSNTWSIHGAAYDADESDGGWVWWQSQDDPGTGFYCHIHQFDPLTMSFTGLNFGYEPTIITDGMAGGLCFNKGFRNMDVLFALVQGTPVDAIVGIFIRWNDTRVEEISMSKQPAAFGFDQNMQSLTKGRTVISYTTNEPGRVLLKIYNTAGTLIKTLVNAYKPAGLKHVFWNSEDDSHGFVPNGVYFLKLEAENKSDVHKLIFIK